jgi:hypothetical protein
MYPKLVIPKKVTEKWLNKAFLPLSDYLEREFPEEKGRIMAYMTFQANEDNRFYYRNQFTKDSIVFDQAGELVSCGSNALQYQFDMPEGEKVERLPRGERFIHPNVARWMRTNLSKKEDEKYGDEVCIFLQEVWGAFVNFDFEDLKNGYPLRGRTPYCLYLYPTKLRSLIAIQFVGDEIVEKRCSYAQYREFEQRERDLIYKGWHVVTITREVFGQDMDQFRLYVSKAIGIAVSR